FAPLGPTYDRYAALLSFGQDPRWRRFLVSRLDVGPTDTVLDVATGTGAVARELIRREGCAVVGLDQSPSTLAAPASRPAAGRGLTRRQHPGFLRRLAGGPTAASVARRGHRGRPLRAAQPRRRHRDLGTARVREVRPAFYALAPGGWRDYVTLLHPPYTLWHLSYVAIGAALAPHLRWGLLGLTVLAFLLAMGVGAHALDELHGRPLETRIPARVLTAAAALSI